MVIPKHFFYFQFQDEPSGQPNLKFRKLLNNDFEYDSEDDQVMDAVPLPPHSSHGHSTSHTSHSTSHSSHPTSHTSHPTSHMSHTTSQSHGQNQQQQPSNQNPADAMAR